MADIVVLTDQEKADLASAVTLGATLNLAEQARQLAMSVQRDLLATGTQCGQMLAAGKHPAVVANVASNQGKALLAVLGKITDANFPTVQAALQAVMQYTPAQSAVVRKVLAAGCQCLANTAADGSSVAADLADLAANFTQPPLLW